MRHPIETEFVQIQNAVCNSIPWEARAALGPNTLGTQALHARSVELVAQPGKTRELGSCVRGTLMDHLKKQRGFAGVIVLSSVKEPRLILVMSFWKSEKDAGNRWESSAAVLKMVSPLIDVCTRVHTHQAAMPGFATAQLPAAAMPIC
jgi:Antibiotic biosynthesis monooxygenase